jgi:Domain of unknown function (DUF4406)
MPEPVPYGVYISGPMQGVPNFNYPLFNCVAKQIAMEQEPSPAAKLPRGREYVVHPINPAQNFEGKTDLSREVYLELALRQVDGAQAILLLPGWEKSPGARLELARAMHNKADVYSYQAGGIIVGPHNYPGVQANLDSTAQPVSDGTSGSPINASRGLMGLEPYPEAKQSRLADNGTLTTFASGATRDTSDGKLDYEGFYNPLVVERFAEYMNKNRIQSDGSARSADNWQKGITRASYIKSMWRHFMDVWKNHRGLETEATLEDALCAVIFNAQGYLFELLQGRDW